MESSRPACAAKGNSDEDENPDDGHERRVVAGFHAGAAERAAKTPAAHGGVATNWKQIAIPELPAFKPQQPKRVVLPNGMIVFLTENHELPLISGSAMIRGGSDSEPADKTGLVEMYGETWRTGGTDKLSGDSWTTIWKRVPPRWKPAAATRTPPSASTV